MLNQEVYSEDFYLELGRIRCLIQLAVTHHTLTASVSLFSTISSYSDKI